jgi:hypothetical protein
LQEILEVGISVLESEVINEIQTYLSSRLYRRRLLAPLKAHLDATSGNKAPSKGRKYLHAWAINGSTSREVKDSQT